MAHDDLPVNVDSSYADDPTHPDVKVHQGHHDELHYLHNLFDVTDVGSWPDGGIPFWVDGDGKFSVLDPSITGSPGPQGIQGHGLRYRGNWSSGASYTIYNGTSVLADDWVTYGSRAYIALADNSNSEPPSANWNLLVDKGSDGAAGTPGATGAQGLQGIPGPTSENYGEDLAATGSHTIDAAEASMWKIVLADDISITLTDTSSAPASAVTFRFVMGAGGPSGITWTNVLAWQTVDGDPPDLSGMAEDDIIVVTLDRMGSEWIGYVPGGTAFTPPPPSYDTLDFEILAQPSASSADQTSDYTFGGAWQVRADALALAAVVLSTTVATFPTPDVPTFEGAGGTVSDWQLLFSETITSTSTSARRLAIFGARISVPGAAGAITVHTSGSVTHTSCAAMIVQTLDDVPPTALALAASKAVGRLRTDSGEVSGTMHCPFAAAADAANRQIIFAVNNTTGITVTPAGGLVQMGTATALSTPVSNLYAFKNVTSFETAPAGTWSAGVIWEAAGTEIEQG